MQFIAPKSIIFTQRITLKMKFLTIDQMQETHVSYTVLVEDRTEFRTM